MIHPSNVPLGLYLNHDSPVHRMGVGWKMAAVTTFLLVSAIAVNTWKGGLACIAIVAVIYAVAKIPPRVAFKQMAGAVPLLLFLSGFLWYRQGLPAAVTTFLTLVSAIAIAIAFTLTTRVSAVMDFLVGALRPLDRFGVPVDTIALAISLTLRMIPLQVMAAVEVLEARRARGATASILAFGVPIIVRTISRSRAMADALIDRGEGD
nr:energy-coupling factor transporter transmembrane component T [Corynebacterium lactis]